MKSREDFESEEAYQQYLLEYSSIEFQSSLIKSTPEASKEEFNSNPRIYQRFAKWALRHSKALIEQLRRKK